MSKIELRQMPAFKKAYKKLNKDSKVQVDDAIKAISRNPKIGTEKKGDLSSVYVHKFKIHKQEYLLAYEWDQKTRMFLFLGVHENFYRDLKKIH